MKTKQKIVRWVILSLLAAILIAAAALSLTDPEIVRSHLGAGGSSSSGIYSLMGSIGQHDAGESLAGETYTLEGGFWAGGVSVETLIYLPLVLR